MGRKSFVKELEQELDEGIKYMGLDMYELAKQAFENIINKVEERNKLKKNTLFTRIFIFNTKNALLLDLALPKALLKEEMLRKIIEHSTS